MKYAVKLKGEFSVMGAGPPPNRTVAVLLIGLLSAGESFSARSELARRLYPHAPPEQRENAFRQTLRRLRGWLGEEVLEAQMGGLRLQPGVFEIIDADAPCVDHRGRVEFAPGIDHPWVSELGRSQSNLPVETSPSVLDNFADAVEAVASLDRVAARRILVSGADLADAMGTERLKRMLAATAPSTDQDPQALDHLELETVLMFRAGYILEARAVYEKVFHASKVSKRPTRAAKAALRAAFLSMEAGEMNEARKWMATAEDSNARRLLPALYANAEAMLIWNANDPNEALRWMLANVPLLRDVDRGAQAHYWVNLAVLAAEAGEFSCSESATLEAEAAVRPGLDRIPHSAIQLARATCKLGRGEVEEAKIALSELRAESNSLGEAPAGWYAGEAHAEALATSGESKAALQAWHLVEETRRARNIRLTPRVAARRARVMALV